MKNIHKKILSSCLLMILFMLSFSTNNTYAYWASNILGAQTNANSSVTIGSWTFSPFAPDGISYYEETESYSTGDIVWYNGNIWINRGYNSQNKTPSNANNWTIYNDINWYSTITYRAGDIIYYNDNIYLSKWTHDNIDPATSGADGAWENQFTDTLSWTSGQATTLNEIVFYNNQLYVYKGYHTTSVPGSQNDWALVGAINYSQNYVYANGDFVLYNGTYYKTTNGGWASSSIPGSDGAWIAVTAPAFTGSVPNSTTYTTYNGLVYKALVTINASNNAITPGTASSKGVWQAINTQEWQQYNTYANGDLVMYQSNVFELANATNSSNTPGTTINSWNGMATINYNALNVYELGEYTVYNSNVYEVVNATNANNNAPGTSANAWNQINGYTYNWFNVYSIGDIVYYDGAVYISISQSTNKQPDLLSSSTYWELYET